MNAEGDDVPATVYRILDCSPPRRLAVTATDDYGTWEVVLELSEANGVVTLRFIQLLTDPSTLENTGPGWDYYLDRLVAAETGGDVAGVDFEADYYPAMRDYYLTLQSSLT